MQSQIDLNNSFAGINRTDLDHVADALSAQKIDFGDIYLQRATSSSLSLEEQAVKHSAYSSSSGCGIRAVCQDKTGFAYTHNFDVKNMLQAAKKAGEIRKHIQADNLRQPVYSDSARLDLYPAQQEPADAAARAALLHELDAYARAREPRIIDCTVQIVDSHEDICVLDTHGNFATDARPLLRIGINVIVAHHGRRESGHAGIGGRSPFSHIQKQSLTAMVDDAIGEARINLEAHPAPAGSMPVVLGSGWPGILLHEAVGHGLEADFNRKQSSVFSNRVGEQVASKLCTVIDNGTLANRRGSLQVDDEGVPSQETILIENGVLRGYMQDKLSARLMKQAPTGNGRRESFSHLPMPRMTNTYMLGGPHHKDEIIASIDKGLYAVNFLGGQVDITSGNFTFSASQAWLIENGKLTKPVKGATLTGNGPNVMQHVSMVANDLAFDPGIGTCGKNGQSVPVGVGLPTIKIDKVVVGGTA